jgi:hypothetical protein
LFERAHHRRIAAILEALDAATLRDNACLFGGGTAMALRFGEYRESVDIDFLVADVAGYRALRELLTGPTGLAALAREGAVLTQGRSLRADQYGVRATLLADGVEIKFEIVREARIQFEAPGKRDTVCGVATLTALDMATSKLLANSDRWADDSVYSRDLIDLAMMGAPGKLLERAKDKARLAYGRSIDADLAKAIDHLIEREGRLERCMAALRMTVPRAQVLARIKKLAAPPPVSAAASKA